MSNSNLNFLIYSDNTTKLKELETRLSQYEYVKIEEEVGDLSEMVHKTITNTNITALILIISSASDEDDCFIKPLQAYGLLKVRGRDIPAIVVTDLKIDAGYAYDYELIDVIKYPYTLKRIDKAIQMLISDRKNFNPLIPSYFEQIHLHILSEVLFIESQNKNAIIHTESGTFETKIPIKTYENYLKMHGFVQTHRSYLVNVNKIRNIDGNIIHFSNSNLKAYIKEGNSQTIKEIWASYQTVSNGYR